VRLLGPDGSALQGRRQRSAHADLTAIAADAMGASEHRFIATLVGTPEATRLAVTETEPATRTGYGVTLLFLYRSRPG
jgi:hypothetical protein